MVPDLNAMAWRGCYLFCSGSFMSVMSNDLGGFAIRRSGHGCCVSGGVVRELWGGCGFGR